MPKYNEMYKLAALDFDIFNDVDYTRQGTKSGENSSVESSETSASGSASSLDAYSDTPQGGLGDLEDLEYLTNARKVTGENESGEERNSERSGENSEEYQERVHGKQGSASFTSLMVEARNAIINIDQMIVEECSDLFMNIF